MLIRFNIKNFRSFDSRRDGKSEEFSMLAGKVRSKKEHVYDNSAIKLLKFAAVYGANASGKSNLIKAIDFMKIHVIGASWDIYENEYCRINEKNKDNNSYFEVEILLDGRYYAYGFEMNIFRGEYSEEWLYELKPNEPEKLIFYRDIDTGEFQIGKDLFRTEESSKLDMYLSDVKSDKSVLFLTAMNQNKKSLYENKSSAINVFANIHEWFKSYLKIDYPHQNLSDYTYILKDDNIGKVEQILSFFNTGIEKLNIVDVEVERVFEGLPARAANNLRKQISMLGQVARRSNRNHTLVIRSLYALYIFTIDKDRQKCQIVKFQHQKSGTNFDLSDESDGTIRLFDLLEILLVGKNKVYIVDEFDRCLHPCITYQFIKEYLKLAADRNIQLVITTHESRLLDFDLLRRDEIWFVQKDYLGRSNIYSLEEYNERFDRKIDKAYLDGRYGGVPLFNTVFPIEG